MNTKLKLLTSSMLVVLVFSIPQTLQAMNTEEVESAQSYGLLRMKEILDSKRRTLKNQDAAEAQILQLHPVALHHIGNSAKYAQGQGIEKNEAETIKHLIKAFKSGWKNALVDLWSMIFKKEANEIFKTTFEERYVKAQDILTLMYEAGLEFVEKNNKGNVFLNIAFEKEFANARKIYDEIEIINDINDIEIKEMGYTIPADKLLAKAEFFVGQMYREGKGVKQNGKKAFMHYQKAADKGLAEAQLCVGLMYSCGEGVEKNETQGVKYLTKAIEQGDAQFLYYLGLMYVEGKGVAKDMPKALELLHKSTAQKFAAAPYKIAEMYSKGVGIEQSDEKAFQYCKEAAELGFSEAQSKLGLMFFLGRGTKEDKPMAVHWFNLAAAQGDKDAQRFLVQEQTIKELNEILESVQ